MHCLCDVEQSEMMLPSEASLEAKAQSPDRAAAQVPSSPIILEQQLRLSTCIPSEGSLARPIPSHAKVSSEGRMT